MIDLRNLNPLRVTRAGFLLSALELYRQEVAYVWGGKSPEVAGHASFRYGGLDCSGFVTHLLWTLTGGTVDCRDTHNADRLMQETPRMLVGDEAQPGDLCFYGVPTHASHVMVHLGGGVVVGQAYGDETCLEPAQSRARGFVTKALPIMYRKDLIAICRPRWAP